MYGVLIVDDEPFIREGLAKLIRWEEYGMYIAAAKANGEQALEFLRQESADIIITDIKMPRLDGIGLMRAYRAAGGTAKYIVLSGYTDFGLVKEAVKMGVENYLIKPVDKEELIQTLNQVTEKLDAEKLKKQLFEEGIGILKDNLLLRWVTGRIAFAELKERREYLDLPLDTDYRAAILKVGAAGEKAFGKYGGGGEASGGCNLAERIRRYTKTARIGEVVWDMQDKYYFLFPDAAGKEIQIKEFLEGLLRYLEMQGGRYFAAAGGPAASPEDLRKSCLEAESILENYEIYSESRILWPDDVHRIEAGLPQVEYEKILALKDLFESEKQEEVFVFAEHMMGELVKMPGIRPENLQVFAVLLVTRIYRNIVNYHSGAEEEIGRLEKMIPQIYELQYPEEILSWIRQRIAEGFAVCEGLNRKYGDIIKRVRRYTEENYRNDLCIKTVAGVFQMNPFYLGRLFKAETGESFTDYLNRYRIGKAKALLANTDLTVKQIAEETGYQNSNYFCTVFKKYAGMPPLEYKKYG